MCLDLVLRNTTDTIFTTNQVKVEIGLKFDDKIEYIPLGIFNISDVKKDDFTTKFTCYDNMFKFDTAYFSKLGDIPTLTQVVNELASITGIQFIGSLPSYTVKKLEGFTCREILSYVASLCGGNALITRDGKFTIIYPTDVNRDIGEGVFDLKRDEVKYKIGKVTCQIKEKETISKGSLGTDSMELQFENPWVTDSILTDIYNRLNGFSYLGYTMKWQGDLSLDVGDIITHIDAKGVNRKLPILNRKLSYDGGLDSELSAKGETKNSNSFNSNGSMKNKVDRVVTEVALINEAFINYAKINDADITNLKAETAKIHNLEVETANINTLLAGNIGSGSIQTIHLTGKNVVIDNAVIKDAMIDTVNANKINTGTLDTNKVTVQGPSGNLLIKDNTIQIKDNTRVRVQIGKDASGDYSMYVWDKQGNVMFDALGLKSSAIKDKIIRDDMVSDNANINGSKLNISSLITEVNKDNTQTLKASKIAFDSTGQSLEVSFNSLKSNVDGLEIGGRNLVKNTKSGECIAVSNYNSGTYSKKVIDVEVAFLGIDKVTQITRGDSGGGDYRVPNILIDTSVNKTYSVGMWVKAVDSDMNFNLTLGVNDKEMTGKDFNLKSNVWTYVSYTKTFSNTPLGTSLRAYMGHAKGLSVQICLVKIEEGTKATSWTPAPEDIDSKIEANTTSITVAQGKIEGLIKESTITKGDVTTLKDNYTNIKATVDGINTTVASNTTSISNAQNTADSKAKVFTSNPTTPYKVGDIWMSGPSGDIMKCKVARASGNYVASDWEKASKYTDDTTANAVATRVTTAESSIKQLNNQIALKVEATEVNNIVNNAINSGNLYLRGTGNNRSASRIVQLNGNNIAVGASRGLVLVVLNRDNLSVRSNTAYDIYSSEMARNDLANQLDSLTDDCIVLLTSYDAIITNDALDNAIARCGGSGTRFTSSFHRVPYALVGIPGIGKGGGIEVFTSLATDAPYAEINTKIVNGTPQGINTNTREVYSNVEKIDTRLQEAEVKITKDAIISTVQSTINTAKSEAINSANSSTDNKLKNYSTTTAMNTAITQSASDITSAVSNTYATKTALGQTTTKVESLEQKVTATAITTTISSAINAGTNSISTTQFVMDKNGLTIKNGALTIKNKANANVLTSDTNGNLTITGTFINKNNNGVDAIKIDSTNIYFYDWDRNARELGIIYSSSLTDYPNVKGFSLAHNQQGYMTLGYRKGTNSFGSYITFDKYGINPTYAAPIRVHESAVFHSAVNMQDRVYMPYTLYLGNNAGTTVPMIFGTNNKLVMQVSVSNKNDGLKIQTNTGGILAQILAGYSYPILLNNNTQVSGNLSATGTKARLVNTKSYGGVRLNALETADALFEDVGEGITDDIGVCYIYLDSVMQETINTKYNYQVFLQKYGEGDLFVLERTENYFIVKGTENLKFAWRFVAKQKGYEMERLEQEKIIVPEEFYSNIEHEKETNYDELASDYLNNFEMELMNIG